jgi:autotransporter-associated beta strand protein
MRFLCSVSIIAMAQAGIFSASIAQAQTATAVDALQVLAPFSTLGNTAAGRAALAANLSETIAVQNGTAGQPLLLSFGQAQEKALRDNTLTFQNAYELADGLGTTLGGTYQSLTSYPASGTPTNISSNLTQLFNYVFTVPILDSNTIKYIFANGTTDGSTPVSSAALALLTANGGTTDVYGTAYNLPAGSPGANPLGNSRPYQVNPHFLAYSGTDFFGAPTSNTQILPSLNTSPAFPSGHTVYGYTDSTLFALMVPQRFQQMITRGAEFANSRIVLGAHYAMDVIGGRTMAYYDLAQMLAENPAFVGPGTGVTNFQSLLAAASSDLNSALQSGCGNTVTACAAEDTGEFSNAAANKAFYESTQTYGLPVVYQSTANTVENVGTRAPEAGYLLETRFPYLTLAQADDVLTSTEGPGGGFLDDGSSYGVYSRLDLYDAGGGYGSFASNVAITMNAALGGLNAADTWSNNISGPGGFTLNGTGKLSFSGADTYTGATTVNGGTLAIDGSIVSPVTVNAGGTLGGTGTLNAATLIKNGGTLAPGDDPGTLTANAPITLSPGSVSQFDIDGPGTGTGAGNYSRLIVIGSSFTPAGTLEPLLRGITGSATNTYVPPLAAQFNIVTASGGIVGTYPTLAQPAGLSPGSRIDVVYGSNSITLATTPVSYANLSVLGVPETSAEAAVGAALDITRPGPNVTNALVTSLYNPLYLAPTAGAVTATLSQLAPAVYGADLVTAADGFEFLNRTVSAQLDARRDDLAATGLQAAQIGHGVQVWVSGLGQAVNVTSDNAPGFSGTFGGVAAGADADLAPGLRAGAAFGYISQNFSMSNNSTASSHTVQGLVYGSYQQGIYFADVQGGIIGLDGSATRQVTAYGAAPNGNYSGFGGGGTLRGGALLNYAGFGVEPSLALTGVTVGHDSLTENQGGVTRQSINSSSFGSLQSLASVRVERLYTLGGYTVVPSASVGWGHEFLDTDAATTATLLVTGNSFTVTTPSVGRNAAIIGVHAELDASAHLKLFLGYEGAFANNSSTNNLTGGLKYSF